MNQSTVYRIRRGLEESGEVMQCITVVGRDGIEQPRRKSKTKPAPKPVVERDGPTTTPAGLRTALTT
ncbi:hypothetical protein [Alienimonas chondri]|uniref:hypothetical protein n=1 Tax=Alienimonas chondri TaxID=2681879 RepID=UPI0014893593